MLRWVPQSWNLRRAGGPRSHAPWRKALGCPTPPTTWKSISSFRISVILKIKCPTGTGWPVPWDGFLPWLRVVSLDVTYYSIPIPSLSHWPLPTIAAPTLHQLFLSSLLLGCWTRTKFKLVSGQKTPLPLYSWITWDSLVCYHTEPLLGLTHTGGNPIFYFIAWK